LVALLFTGPVPGWAQDEWGVRDSETVRDLGMDEIVEEGLRENVTGTGYYDSGTVARDLSAFITRDPQTGEEKEVLITVFEGERVFCSICNLRLRDTTHFRNVTLEESCYYYDDGTHGDLFANDGLPSFVVDHQNKHICPYCYAHMIYLEELRDRAKWRDVREAVHAGRQPLVPEEPQTFYANVPVVANDDEDLLPHLAEKSPMRRYDVLNDRRKDTVARFEREVINSFKYDPKPEDDKEVFVDYLLHRDEFARPIPQVQQFQPSSPWQQEAYPYSPGGF